MWFHNVYTNELQNAHVRAINKHTNHVQTHVMVLTVQGRDSNSNVQNLNVATNEIVNLPELYEKNMSVKV